MPRCWPRPFAANAAVSSSDAAGSASSSGPAARRARSATCAATALIERPDRARSRRRCRRCPSPASRREPLELERRYSASTRRRIEPHGPSGSRPRGRRGPWTTDVARGRSRRSRSRRRSACRCPGSTRACSMCISIQPVSVVEARGGDSLPARRARTRPPAACSQKLRPSSSARNRSRRGRPRLDALSDDAGSRAASGRSRSPPPRGTRSAGAAGRGRAPSFRRQTSSAVTTPMRAVVPAAVAVRVAVRADAEGRLARAAGCARRACRPDPRRRRSRDPRARREVVERPPVSRRVRSSGVIASLVVVKVGSASDRDLARDTRGAPVDDRPRRRGRLQLSAVP